MTPKQKIAAACIRKLASPRCRVYNDARVGGWRRDNCKFKRGINMMDPIMSYLAPILEWAGAIHGIEDNTWHLPPQMKFLAFLFDPIAVECARDRAYLPCKDRVAELLNTDANNPPWRRVFPFSLSDLIVALNAPKPKKEKK